MNRTLTIKGTGRLTLKPDWTVVTLTLKSLDKQYEKAMAESAARKEKLNAALAAVGFDPRDVKTADFSVSSEYEGVHDKNGNYKNVFVGYACRHTLKLEFPFENRRLSAVLGAVAGCLSDPELNVQFTVKDKESAGEALLRDAAENAKRRAAVLAEASGVELGQLMDVDYSWGDVVLYSPTSFYVESKVMGMSARSNAVDISPDDIVLTDTVTFVWEIK
jgi:uncharacterized protein YggE